MRVAVAHDDVLSRRGATPDEVGVLEAAEAVQLALQDLGHTVVRVPIGPDLAEWTARLSEAGADLVFNLCEGVAGESSHETRVAAVLELLRLPMTGSPSEVLALTRRKDVTNALLQAHDLPVPAWTTIRDGEPLPDWNCFPAIVKPTAEDASVGVTRASVVANRDELREAVSRARGLGGLLIQSFVAGREFVVGFVGARVLPLAEIEFVGWRGGGWPLVTYEAKWSAGSEEDRATAPRCPADVDAALAERAAGLAEAAWTAVAGRGYGRVDLRTDQTGRLFVLEVNPNPDLSPTAGLTRMATADGWSYVDLIENIVREAVA